MNPTLLIKYIAKIGKCIISAMTIFPISEAKAIGVVKITLKDDALNWVTVASTVGRAPKPNCQLADDVGAKILMRFCWEPIDEVANKLTSEPAAETNLVSMSYPTQAGLSTFSY
jgi:hypothetical protein